MPVYPLQNDHYWQNDVPSITAKDKAYHCGHNKADADNEHHQEVVKWRSCEIEEHKVKSGATHWLHWAFLSTLFYDLFSLFENRLRTMRGNSHFSLYNYRMLSFTVLDQNAMFFIYKLSYNILCWCEVIYFLWRFKLYKWMTGELFKLFHNWSVKFIYKKNKYIIIIIEHSYQLEYKCTNTFLGQWLISSGILHCHCVSLCPLAWSCKPPC